jgi:ElaA protein
MDFTYTCKSFETLTLSELYDILQLRSSVFVVEQNCVYLDCDRKDLHSKHILMYKNNQLVATARILPIGIAYPDYVSIGRVCNATSMRGTGIGKLLMRYAIAETYSWLGVQPIKIGAQAYLKKFYSDLGFEDKNLPYIEDNIPHIIMLKP